VSEREEESCPIRRKCGQVSFATVIDHHRSLPLFIRAKWRLLEYFDRDNNVIEKEKRNVATKTFIAKFFGPTKIVDKRSATQCAT
jgi:hypothetical protein